MDKILIIMFITTPIAMLGSGFLIARQLPIQLYTLIVRRRLLWSVFNGILISLMFTLIIGLADGFSTQLLVVYVGLFFLSTSGYYFGLVLGGRNSAAVDETTAPVNHQADADIPFSENVLVENSLASVKITVTTKKRWGRFALEVFQFVVIGLFGLPILSLIAITFLQERLPQIFHLIVWVLVGGSALYLLYVKGMGTLEHLADKEVIELDNRSVRIRKYGSRFSRKQEYRAENIKLFTGFLSLNAAGAVKRSPSLNANLPAFMILHHRGLKRVRTFGSAIDIADAGRILELVYARYPQYKGSPSTSNRRI